MRSSKPLVENIYRAHNIYNVSRLTIACNLANVSIITTIKPLEDKLKKTWWVRVVKALFSFGSG